MQILDPRRRDFVEQHGHQPRLRAAFLIIGRQICRSDHELAQQGVHRDGAARCRQARIQCRIDEGIIPLQHAGRLDRMKRAAGNPHRAAGRHDPQASLDLAAQGTALDEQELAFAVAVEIDLDLADLADRKADRDDGTVDLVGIEPF